jgi:translation initiation factor IF-2
MVEKKGKVKEKKTTVKKSAKPLAEKKAAPKKVSVKTVRPVKEKKTSAKVAPKAKRTVVGESHEKKAVPEIIQTETVKIAAPKVSPAKAAQTVPVAPSVPAVEKKPEIKPVVPKVQEVPKPKATPVVEAPKPKAETLAVQAPKVAVPEPPKVVAPPPPPAKPVIEIRFPITVGDLAQKMNRRIPEVIKALMGIGIFANVNQLLNEEIVFAAGKLLGSDQKMEDDGIRRSSKATKPKILKNWNPPPPVCDHDGSCRPRENNASRTDQKHECGVRKKVLSPSISAPMAWRSRAKDM